MRIQMFGRAFVMEGDRHARGHDGAGTRFECVADVATIDLAFVAVEVQRPVVGELVGFLFHLSSMHRPCQLLDLRGEL
jgi:hypothetical protein